VIFIYSTGCAVYELMLSKVCFDISNPFRAVSVVGKGNYKKIVKISEGGTYSDEFVDIIHSLMELVSFFIFHCLVYFIYIFRNENNNQIFKNY
jgi:site-specific recombinase XerD